MPKVIVYVPAAAWRKLEARGLNPAEAVREFAKRGYETQERTVPDAGPRDGGLEPSRRSEPAGSTRSESGQSRAQPSVTVPSPLPPPPDLTPGSRDDVTPYFKPDPKPRRK